jgi:hypothetical protein
MGFGKFMHKVGSFLGGKAPKQKPYGGSEEQYKKYQESYGKGEAGGNAMVQRGVSGAKESGESTAKALEGVAGQQDKLAAGYGKVATTAGAAQAEARGQYNTSRSDYLSGRTATLNNAQAVERLANNLPQNYQQTAERQLAVNQGRNVRAAMSAGAAGGAGGIRNAVASAASANADAAAQAEITRAQEYNQLTGMQAGMYGQAAGIRGDVGGRDLGAAGQAADVANAAGAERLSAMGGQGASYGAKGQMIGAAGDSRYRASALETEAGTAQRGQYLGAQTTMEGTAAGIVQPGSGGFLGAANNVVGALGLPKAGADAVSMGPETKLVGKREPSQPTYF